MLTEIGLEHTYQRWSYNGTEFKLEEDNSQATVNKPSSYTPEKDVEMFACFRKQYEQHQHQEFAVLFCRGELLSRSARPAYLENLGWTVLAYTGEGGFGWYWVSR